MSRYEEKIQREQDWYRNRGFQRGHFLNSGLFFSAERVGFSDLFLRTQFAASIREVIEREGMTDPRLLIAPTGSGNDLPYLMPLSRRMTGVDISPAALAAIPEGALEKHVGDIKHMVMFENDRFDVVVMSQFFHPFALGAWCAKKLCGNITGCVEDETPSHPGRLLAAMRRCGFQDVTLAAASYSHRVCRFPLRGSSMPRRGRSCALRRSPTLPGAASFMAGSLRNRRQVHRPLALADEPAKAPQTI